MCAHIFWPCRLPDPDCYEGINTDREVVVYSKECEVLIPHVCPETHLSLCLCSFSTLLFSLLFLVLPCVLKTSHKLQISR